MNRGTILLRVDGSASQGLGQVARSLALANALQRRRYQMTFISQIDNAGWPDRIRRFRHAVVKTPHAAGSDADHEQFLKEVHTRHPAVVVTDSAAIGPEYLDDLVRRVPLVISIEDSPRFCYPSGLVLNPSLGESASDFAVGPDGQIVTGHKYAMIRAEFRRARNVRATEPGGPTRVLVALGGGDTGESTLRAAQGLLETRLEKIDLVVGIGCSHLDRLMTLVEKHSDRLSITSDARDMGLRMSKAHLLVTGGGNLPLEAACVGIPMLLIGQRPSQEKNALWLEEAGAAQYLGPKESVKADRIGTAAVDVLGDNFERKSMSRSGRMLIDGRGGDRLVTATEILLRRSRRRKALQAA